MSLFSDEEMDKQLNYNKKIIIEQVPTRVGLKIYSRQVKVKTADEAINEVEINANQIWLDKAYEVLLYLIANHPIVVTDMVWIELEKRNIPRPHSPSAMGAVFRRAYRDNKIRKTGRYIKSMQLTNHNRDVPEWRSLV